MQFVGLTLNQLTIKSDGTYTDDGGTEVISVGSNTVSKKWAISGKVLTLTATDSNGSSGEFYLT